MEPFEDATDTIQGECTVTSSKAIPCVIGLKHHLDSLEKESKNCKELISTLNESLHKRMNIYCENKNFIIATILDPQFKNVCVNKSNEEVCELLMEEMRNFRTEPAQSEEILCESPPKKKKLFSFLNEKKTSKSLQDNSINSEVLEYLKEQIVSEEMNPLHYWKDNAIKYPNMAKVALKYLSICASSGPVERLYSVAEEFYTSSHTALKEENFENLILIKLNKKLK